MQHGDIVTVLLPQLHTAVTGIYNRPLPQDRAEIFLDTGAVLVTPRAHITPGERPRDWTLLGLCLAAASGALTTVALLYLFS